MLKQPPSPPYPNFKTNPAEYSFSVSATAVQNEQSKAQHDLMIRANIGFGLIGNEQKPATIKAGTIKTISTTAEFKAWLYSKHMSLMGHMDDFMLNLVIGHQDSGKSSFEAARYAWSHEEREHGQYITIVVVPKTHRKVCMPGFEPHTQTEEESEDLFEQGNILSNHALGAGGDCQLLLAISDDRWTHFAEWRYADGTGLANYVRAVHTLDGNTSLPVMIKIEESMSTGKFSFTDAQKRYNQKTCQDISEEPKVVTKNYNTMPFVKHIMCDGERNGFKGFELTLHKLSHLVCEEHVARSRSSDSTADNIDMDYLTRVLNWVFIVFNSKKDQLWTEDHTGLIQELADKWDKDKRDRLQWYVETHCDKHDVLAIEFHALGEQTRGPSETFPTDFCDESTPWKKFFVIKGAAYEEHVAECKDKVANGNVGYLANLYHDKTIKGIFT